MNEKTAPRTWEFDATRIDTRPRFSGYSAINPQTRKVFGTTVATSPVGAFSELLRRIITEHGTPETVITDDRPDFTRPEVEEIFASHGIRHELRRPYNPSVIERAYSPAAVLRKAREERMKRRLERLSRSTPLFGEGAFCRIDMRRSLSPEILNHQILPTICVETIPRSLDAHGDGRTRFWFRDRQGFRAAYRLARTIRRGRRIGISLIHAQDATFAYDVSDKHWAREAR